MPALFTRMPTGRCGVGEASDDGGHTGVVRQVRGQHLSRDSVAPFQVRRCCFEPGPVPGHQHQVVALGGQLPGKLGPQACAGTGDQGCGGCCLSSGQTHPAGRSANRASGLASRPAICRPPEGSVRSSICWLFRSCSRLRQESSKSGGEEVVAGELAGQLRVFGLVLPDGRARPSPRTPPR